MSRRTSRSNKGTPNGSGRAGSAEPAEPASNVSSRKRKADEDIDEFGAMTVPDLRALLRGNKLSTKGNKATLRARLESNGISRTKRARLAEEDCEVNQREFFVGELPLQNALKKRVLVINTGGTLGMKRSSTGAWATAPGYLNKELKNLPNQKSLPHFDVVEMAPLLDSSDIEPKDWIHIAENIQDNYDDYDGFVVLHGTDTMSYTASAISFMLENLSKTVVFTGSCVPYCEIYNDAQRNIIVALLVASTSKIPEVVLFFDDLILRGNRTTKADAWGLDGFKSYNYGCLGKLANKIDIFWERILPMPVSPRTKELLPLVVHKNFDVRIACIHLIPGFSEASLEAVIRDPEIQGIVLRAYGAGNAPKRKRKLLDALSQAISRDVVVVVLSQCQKGSVILSEYATGEALARTGVVSGFNMTVEAATTKLAFLLGKGISTAEVKRLMGKSLVGELHEKSAEAEHMILQHDTT